MTVEPLTYTVPEVARALRIRQAKAYELVKDGTIPSIKHWGRTLVPRAALERVLLELADA